MCFNIIFRVHIFCEKIKSAALFTAEKNIEIKSLKRFAEINGAKIICKNILLSIQFMRIFIKQFEIIFK